MKKSLSTSLLFLGIVCSFVSAAEINSTNITQAPYSCATNATSCNLNNKGITSIASGTFRNHSSLQNLYLYNNQISSIESGAFIGLNSLNRLDLSSSQISSIESGAFIGLYNLTYLSLFDNKLTHLKYGTFYGLTNLAYLHLFSNYISTIDSGTFIGLSNISEIRLNHNYITSIEPGDFNGLSCNNIYLSVNYITSIESGDFNGLSCSYIYLDYNNISSIEMGSFDNMPLLWGLGLSNNPLTSISYSLFDNITDIRDIDLTNTCFLTPVNNDLSYCSDNNYTDQASCESAGSCLDGSYNTLSQYTDRASCEDNYSCSDSQYTDQMSCQNAGACSDSNYSDESSCVSNGVCSNPQYTDQASCESAGYCLDGSWNVLGQYTDQMSCESEYSCSDSQYTDQMSCQDNGGSWMQNQWQNVGEYWSYNSWFTYGNQWMQNQRQTNGNTRTIRAQVVSDNNYCSVIESNNQSSFISALKGAYLENNYYITTLPISFVSSATNQILANTTMVGSGSGIEVEYDNGTIITTNNEAYTGILLQPVSIATGAIKVLDKVISATKFGDSTKRIDFSKPVTVRLPAPGKSIGSSVSVYYAQNIENPSWFFHTKTSVINIEGSPYVEFTTDHATYFAIGEEVGSFTINNDAVSTTTQSVTLNISGAGITHMKFSNDNINRSSWQTYNTSTSWSLSAGIGTKTVYAEFDTDSDTIADATTSDTIIFTEDSPSGSGNQGTLKLEILGGASECMYGTSLNLGTKTSEINSSYTFTGTFTGDWYCMDYKGISSGRAFTIQTSDLSGNNGGVISGSNVWISHNIPFAEGAGCTGYIGTSTQFYSTALPIMEKISGYNNICKVTLSNVGLQINVPANTTPGDYQGVLTMTLPNGF